MLIIGAKGHAKEILDILTKANKLDDIQFYDDISDFHEPKLYGKFEIIRSLEECQKIFKKDKRFILGIGNPRIRFQLAQKFLKIGGELESVMANDAIIGSWNCHLGKGVNIMNKVLVSNDTSIGEGALINAGCNIHHDSIIGRYCEISPMVVMAGHSAVGDFSSIGAGAVILPGLKIGKNVTIGAGAVVNRDIKDDAVAVGIPAKIIKFSEPFEA